MGVYFKLSTMPKYCSNCGSLLFKKVDLYTKAEYDAKTVASCSNCGTRFVKAEKDDLSESFNQEIESHTKLFKTL